MKIRKSILIFVVALFLFASVPAQVMANPNPTTVSDPLPNPSPTEQYLSLVNRLNEINTLDKTEMSHKEKRALRKEVKGIERDIKELNNGGVYISVGAVILIIILLIILL